MFGETLIEQAFSFAIFILMARVLTKAELGTFAIVFILMDMGREITRAGVFQQIARKKSLSSLELDTIFWINIALGWLWALIMVMFGIVGQDFFQAPQLATVTAGTAIAMVIAATGNTHMALRLREFGHRTMAVRSLIASIVGAVIAVGGVIAGFGIWAFVAQRIAREAVVSVFAWLSVEWRPRWRFDRADAQADLAFAREIVSANLVGYLTLRAQDLIIARMLGPALLSVYRVAWRSAELLGPQMVAVFSNVGLQTFSRLQEDRAALRLAYRSVLRSCALLTIPALAGYGVAGPWLVPAIFGAKWVEAGQLAPVLAFLAIPFAVSYFFQVMMAALGRPKWQRHLALADMLSTIIVSLFTVHFGLWWVAVAYVARAYLWIPVEFCLIRRASGIGFGDHFWAFWPALLASSVMVGAVWAGLHYLHPAGLVPLAAICLAGAALYVALILICVPSLWRELRAMPGAARKAGDRLVRPVLGQRSDVN